MKTKEELNSLKEEYVELNKKLTELAEEELAQVTGGELPKIRPDEKYVMEVNDSIWKSDKLPTEPGSYKMGADIKIKDKIRP